MQRNVQVRTVSEKKAKASNSTGRDRIKAWITNKIEQWISFSPRNRAATLQTTRRVLAAEMRPRLALERFLGSK